MPYPIYDTVTAQTAVASERELSFRLLREILEETMTSARGLQPLKCIPHLR